MDHTPEVDAEAPLPGHEGQLRDGAGGGHAGVVAQHVGRPVGLDDGVAQSLDRRPGGHVTGDRHGLAPRGSDGVHRVMHGRLLDVGHDHSHGLGREALGQPPADAAGAPGDHRHPASEISHGARAARAS